MSKPEDIPQDVWDSTTGAYIAYCDEQSRLTQAPTEDELLNVAARAIMAERERAAKVAVNFATEFDAGLEQSFFAIFVRREAKMISRMLNGLAFAIRKGTP